MRFRVLGLDCSTCVSEIERALRSTGVDSVHVSIASEQLTLPSTDRKHLPAIERALTAAGFRLERLDGDDEDARPVHATIGYRRTLWIVVGLNLGFGAVEGIGGLLAGSQALKADALDFVGDGLITGLGLLAVGWSPTWRARSALVQGWFLGALGLSILATSLYRVFVLQVPEALTMGVFAACALVVNLTATWVLVPYRAGDANVRTVWLFSRNDAVGNVAVLLAAGLVAWSGSAWPDLLVAVFIAALFVHSASTIVSDARRDLQRTRPQTSTDPDR